MKFFLFFILMSTSATAAEIMNTTVGQVSDHVVTSREVIANLLVDEVLFEGPRASKDVRSKAFARQVNAVLIEWVVYNEAVGLGASSTNVDAKLKSGLVKTKSRLARKRRWLSLEFTDSEVEELLRRKIIAKDFIQFKASSSVVPITDTEAREYYNENQSKFGSAPFDSLKVNIKNYLNRKQVDDRMKAWFEILQAKYKVKNLIM